MLNKLSFQTNIIGLWSSTYLNRFICFSLESTIYSDISDIFEFKIFFNAISDYNFRTQFRLTFFGLFSFFGESFHLASILYLFQRVFSSYLIWFVLIYLLQNFFKLPEAHVRRNCQKITRFINEFWSLNFHSSIQLFFNWICT